MFRGRVEHDWSQTSEILAVLYNVNRDPKKQRKAWKASDFNPYASKEKAKPRMATDAEMEMLRDLFRGDPSLRLQPR